MKLDAMPAGARTAKLAELKAMDAEGLARENTIARNQLMIDGLGLGNAEKETLWGGADVPPATKRKSVGEGRKSGHKKTKQRLDPVLRENQSDSGDDSDADESPAPPVKQKPAGKARKPQMSKSGAVAKSKAAGKEKNAKAWVVTAKELLMKKDFGGGWPALVGVWWKREEKVGFEGTVSNAVCHRRRRGFGNTTDYVLVLLTRSKAIQRGNDLRR
jgi:hypothetical protein